MQQIRGLRAQLATEERTAENRLKREAEAAAREAAGEAAPERAKGGMAAMMAGAMFKKRAMNKKVSNYSEKALAEIFGTAKGDQ